MDRSEADGYVVDTVRIVRDRFGADGLRDLVTLATRELQRAEQAAAGLTSFEAEPESDPQRSHAEPADMADTQAWMAFTSKDS
jgi:hypothetical protein